MCINKSSEIRVFNDVNCIMNELKLGLFVSFIIFITNTPATWSEDISRLDPRSYLSSKLLFHREIRPRRWIYLSEVHVSIGDWILVTQLNNHLRVSSNFTSNWIINNSMIHMTSNDNCEALHGHVHDSKYSLAIMTICGNNFYAFFQLGNRSFSVWPSSNGSHTLEETEHKIMNEGRRENARVKRDMSTVKQFNLTGDTIDLDEDSNAPTNIEREPAHRHEFRDSFNYFSERMWIKPELSKKAAGSSTQRWLELGIAVDYSVIDFHGERVQQYVLALLNIVSAIFRDPSLEANLTLVISRMIFLVDKKDSMVLQGNARKSLENVNKWNRKALLSSNKGHDVAVWLTRLDIGGPSGYAPVSGACDPARSCALNRDEGLTSAFIIAHELAHILGLTHDGDEAANNSCGEEALSGSVMAPMVAATFHRFHWSSCSKEEFHHRAKKWFCLNNSPDVENVTQLKAFPHANTFTIDEQCRMEFGEGYGLCKSFDLSGLCSHLWCGHKSSHQVCKTKKGPPLDGTACGEDKWCMNGSCEPSGRLGPLANNPRTSWTKCSTSCGVGVRFRRCTNLGFDNGDNKCQDNNQDFAICLQSPCPLVTDLRGQQCHQLSNLIDMERPSERQKMTWLPAELDDESVKCRVTCRNSQTGRVYTSNDYVIDGTRCSYGSSDICIQGKCYSMGCDHLLNSKKRLDACGVCGGDNSTCISISNKFQRKIRRANVRVARVPSSSFEVSVEIEIIPPLKNTKFVLRNARRHKFDAPNLDSHNSTLLVVEGTAFRLQKIYDVYKIWGRGPTLAQVIISLKVSQEEVNQGSIVFVNFRYIMDRGKDNKTNTYSWSIGGWSSCSVTCGGGVRRRTIACKNEQNGRIENWKKCKLSAKPLELVEPCNVFSCEFKWIAGPWEGCSKTCGAHGVQHRQIYCVHSSFTDNQVTRDNDNIVYRLMLSPNLCNQHRPPEIEQACNKIPCQGNWILTEWSPCTRTCGRGLQSRMVRCASLDGESLFDCEGTKTPDELRPCRSHGRKFSGCENSYVCRRNKSRYCIVPSFKKYCRIPEFKTLCCRTCNLTMT